MSKKIVLFDLDGTLINTLPAIANSFNSILNKYGYNTYETKKYSDFVGGGFVKVLERINKIQEIKIEKNQFISEVRKHYDSNYLHGIKIYENMDKLLDKLSQNNIDIAIVTNKDHPMALEHAKTILSKWDFKYVYGASVNKEYPTKPNPYLVDLIAKDYKKDEMLFVGDMIVDYNTAKNANVDMVYCTWGYGKEQDIDSFIANDPLDILKYL